VRTLVHTNETVCEKIDGARKLAWMHSTMMAKANDHKVGKCCCHVCCLPSGLALLQAAQVESPDEVDVVRLHSRGIGCIQADEVAYFCNLR